MDRADLLRHRLLQASFISPEPIRELLEVTCYRKTLIQERADETNRLQKVLEMANLKLATVATNVLSTSGRAMLEAILGEQHDPQVLAELARGRLRSKLPALQQALDGHVQPYHRFLLTRILAHIDFLEESLLVLQQEIEERLTPYAEEGELLKGIASLQEKAIATVINEKALCGLSGRLLRQTRDDSHPMASSEPAGAVGLSSHTYSRASRLMSKEEGFS